MKHRRDRGVVMVCSLVMAHRYHVMAGERYRLAASKSCRESVRRSSAWCPRILRINLSRKWRTQAAQWGVEVRQIRHSWRGRGETTIRMPWPTACISKPLLFAGCDFWAYIARGDYQALAAPSLFGSTDQAGTTHFGTLTIVWDAPVVTQTSRQSHSWSTRAAACCR
jgi:hypothetical protein